jgi:hypothetical protein
MRLKTSSTSAEDDVFGVGENWLRLIAAIHFMERDGLRQSDSPDWQSGQGIRATQEVTLVMS